MFFLALVYHSPKQINAIRKSCYYQLRDFAHIRCLLDDTLLISCTIVIFLIFPESIGESSEPETSSDSEDDLSIGRKKQIPGTNTADSGTCF